MDLGFIVYFLGMVYSRKNNHGSGLMSFLFRKVLTIFLKWR